MHTLVLHGGFAQWASTPLSHVLRGCSTLERGWCQGTTCFLLQKHLGVLPTLTLDTFGILQTLTTSKFQRHFGVLLILSPFWQSPTLLCAPSTLTPHPTLPPKITPRPRPPLKVAQRRLWTPYPPIWTLLWHSSETLQVIAEIRQLSQHLILRVMLLK